MEAPAIRLELRQQDAGELKVVVRDNGPGLPPEAMEGKTKSFGMQLIRSLTKQLRATLEIRNEDGAVFELILPESARASTTQ